METSTNGISLIKHFEGTKLTAYADPRGIYTISTGCIRIDGRSVKKGDVITQAKADSMLAEELEAFEGKLTKMLGKVVITQSQWDALISFSFNLGSGALGGSTLLKKVLANPNDPSIADEFPKWRNKGTNFELGLLTRRLSEYHLYSTGKLDFDFAAEAKKIMGK